MSGRKGEYTTPQFTPGQQLRRVGTAQRGEFVRWADMPGYIVVRLAGQRGTVTEMAREWEAVE